MATSKVASSEKPRRLNVVLKMEINQLARHFYSTMGYRVPEFYDFSAAVHPQEKLCWRMALDSFDYWMNRR